jgi:hypothetical protein
MKNLILIICIFILTGCGYGFTSLKNKWEKDDVNTVNVPIFANKTMEGGAEVQFTNALRMYFKSRSGKLKLVRSNGDAYIKGSVDSISLSPAGVIYGTQATEDAGGLSNRRVLAISYVITTNVTLQMIRAKDQKVLWSQSFSQSQSMSSGSFTDERRSSNVFIKESAKGEAIRDLANLTMRFAVDSLLEEF